MKLKWESIDNKLKPFLCDEITGSTMPVTWTPQEGSQKAFLQCPIFEVLYCGTRGPGKTDALLMDFAQQIGQGYGKEWKGILFRRNNPELQDVIGKSKKWFTQIFPDAKYNESQSTWTFANGEQLQFRHFERPDSYYKYHGHSYTWIAWEELTTWPIDECYKSMFSCARSTVKGIPISIRSTTNPYGVGHNWVKQRFQLPVSPRQTIGKIIRDDSNLDHSLERVAIHGHIEENKILLSADPGYLERIKSATRNPNELDAWLHGSWDIVAGGMFDDIWASHRKHIVVPTFNIPHTWRVYRAFDWGSSKPFSVGWWAQNAQLAN